MPWIKLQLSLALAAFLLWPAMGLAQEISTAQNLNDAITAKLSQLKKINEEINKNQRELDQVQGQQKTLQRELTKIDYSVKQLNLSIRSSEINIDKLALELAALGEAIGTAERKIDLQKTAIFKLIRQLQEKDSESLLTLLLRGESLAQSFLEIQTITDLNQNLGVTVAELQQLHDNLSKTHAERSDKKANLESENRNLKNRRSILADQKQERGNLLALTKNQEKLYQQKLTDLEEKQSQIGEEIEKIEEELRRTFDPNILPAKRPGVLALPVPKPPKLTQHYGETAFAQRAYRSRFHNGLDFGAPTGTEVFAAESGQVIAVGDNGRFQYGKYIVIKHDNNLTTLYAHLSRPAVTKGDTVNKNQLIGYIGNTGYAFGSHLHLTVYWGPSVRLEIFPQCPCGEVPVGITIDPEDYLENVF